MVAKWAWNVRGRTATQLATWPSRCEWKKVPGLFFLLLLRRKISFETERINKHVNFSTPQLISNCYQHDIIASNHFLQAACYRIDSVQWTLIYFWGNWLSELMSFISETIDSVNFARQRISRKTKIAQMHPMHGSGQSRYREARWASPLMKLGP